MEKAVEKLIGLPTPLGGDLKSPMPDFRKTEWIPLGSHADAGAESEIHEDEHLYNVSHPSIGVYRTTLGKAPRPAVVICPGGGYGLLSIVKEGEEVARWFNSVGVDAYVLKYRMKEFRYPAPLEDVAAAIRYLRSNAPKLGLNPEKIGALGFSAGGHVAAMASTLYDSAEAAPGDEPVSVSTRPDFAVLCYPVISLRGPNAHDGSRINLLGENAPPELAEALSLETRVTSDTPPTFLWHSADDPAVPVENSLAYAGALAAHNIPFALHVFPSAPHGIGMRPGFGAASDWPALLAEWLKEGGIIDTH